MVVNIMLNQLTSHNAMLQVALLVGKHASWLAAKLKYKQDMMSEKLLK